MSTHHGVVIDDKLDDHLQKMIDSGLYGDSAGEAINFAIQVAAQAAIADGIIKLASPEAEVEEYSPPRVTGPNCPHDRTDDNCGKRGCLGAALPF